MEKNTGSTQKLFGYFVTAFASCKTILRWHRRAPVLALSLTFALSACNQKTENHTHNPPPDYTGSNMGGGNGGGSVTGTGDGGGGQGIACTDKVKDPRFRGKVMVRDIYEAIRNHNRTMKTIPNDVSGTDTVSPEAIKVLVESLKHFYGPASGNLEFVNEKFWFDFVKKISFLDDEYKLHPSQDANSPIALPDECKIVQIAFWDESAGIQDEGSLYISKKLWKQLSQLGKIGLLAHEYFFQQARNADYKNSDFVRLKVGELLSLNGLKPLFESWKKSKSLLVGDILPESKVGFKMCKGTSKEDPFAKLTFIQYAGEDGLQHIVLSSLQSKMISVGLLSPFHYKFDPKAERNLSVTLDILGLQEEFSGHAFRYIENDSSHRYSLMFKNSGRVDFLFNNTNAHMPIDDPRNAILTSLLSLSSLKVSDVWNGFVSGGNGLVKLSINNPGSGFVELAARVPAKEVLVTKIHSMIRERFRECNGWDDYKDMDIDGVITALQSEIKVALDSGRFPIGFPKWRAALNLFVENNNYSIPGAGVHPCRNYLDKFIEEEIPNILYKTEIGTLEHRDVELFEREVRETYPDSYTYRDFSIFEYQNDHSTIKPVQIVARVGSKETQFDLSCRSYMDVYNDVSAVNQIGAEKVLDFDMKIDFDPKSNFKISYQNAGQYDRIVFSTWKNAKPRSGEMEAYNNRETAVNEIIANKVFKLFANTISSREYQTSMLKNYSDQCDSECRDLKMLFGEMSMSDFVKVRKCSDLNDVSFQAGAKEAVAEGCAVLTPNVSKTSFRIFYRYAMSIYDYEQQISLSEIRKNGDNGFSDVSPKIVFVERVFK